MLHQNGQRNNSFAYSPVVDAPYAMMPDDAAFDEAPPVYPPCPSDYGPAPAPKPELPGWRNTEPRFVHSLKWHDHDGIEHLHVVRSDDLDEVLREIGMVKAFIKAARARDEKPVATTPAPQAEPEQEQADSAYDEPETDDEDYCPTHGRAKLRPSRYGGVFCAARLRDGSYCKYKSRKGARS